MPSFADPYRITHPAAIPSPAPVLFKELLASNLDRMIEIAGDPQRLRPHCKTHKMTHVTRMEVARGITRHKAATIAEVEMLFEAGASDVLLAYNPVGPNIERVVRIAGLYPDRTFAVTADHPLPVERLSAAASAAEVSLNVFLDLDIGMHRTGIAIGDEAAAIAHQIVESPGLSLGGFHAYDGHHRVSDVATRRQMVQEKWANVSRFRARLEGEGLPVPEIVAGGTPTFPLWAEIDAPGLQLSPGTSVFHDAKYGGSFPDLPFTPAVLLLGRVISKPVPGHLTLDLGSKSVASDPAAGHRFAFPDLPDAEEVMHSEEHLSIKTASADDYEPGDEILAIPVHVCPTLNLHQFVHVIEGGEVIDRWPVTARQRFLTV